MNNIIKWEKNGNNYVFNTVIDNTNIQLQFNKIKNNDWLYVVYFDNQEQITPDIIENIINLIDANNTPVSFNKILFTSNNQMMITGLYKFTEEDIKYKKSISYINGKPYPSLENNDDITESIKFKIKLLFEGRKIKDDLTTVIYKTQNGNIKFMNNTYDFNNQTYKITVQPDIDKKEIEEVLSEFIKDKEPDTLIFTQPEYNKKVKMFLNKKHFDFKNDYFIFTGDYNSEDN